MEGDVMNTVKISRQKVYRSPLYQGPGYEWKWVYYLPQHEQTTPDGRTVQMMPGGFSTKAETVDLARQVYAERPLRLEFPDGTTKEIKR